MTREELIEYIKANDLHYDYSKVKFDFYTDEELQAILKRIKRKKNLDEKEKDREAGD